MNLVSIFNNRKFNQDECIKKEPEIEPSSKDISDYDSNPLHNIIKPIKKEYPPYSKKMTVEEEDNLMYKKFLKDKFPKVLDFDSCYGYNELSANLFDDDNDDFDDHREYKSEVRLFNTYVKGRTYEDRYKNTYRITDINDTRVHYIRNRHLFDEQFDETVNEESMSRGEFLERMNYKAGDSTECIMYV